MKKFKLLVAQWHHWHVASPDNLTIHGVAVNIIGCTVHTLIYPSIAAFKTPHLQPWDCSGRFSASFAAVEPDRSGPVLSAAT